MERSEAWAEVDICEYSNGNSEHDSGCDRHWEGEEIRIACVGERSSDDRWRFDATIYSLIAISRGFTIATEGETSIQRIISRRPYSDFERHDAGVKRPHKCNASRDET